MSVAFSTHTHYFCSHLSFGGIVLLTHSSGFVFSFCAFVLFLDQLSRHRRDDLWLPQPDTALELVSHEKNSAPPQGSTQFSRTSLIGLTWVTSYSCASHGVREIGCSKELGWSFVLFLEMKPQLQLLYTFMLKTTLAVSPFDACFTTKFTNFCPKSLMRNPPLIACKFYLRL